MKQLLVPNNTLSTPWYTRNLYTKTKIKEKDILKLIDYPNYNYGGDLLLYTIGIKDTLDVEIPEIPIPLDILDLLLQVHSSYYFSNSEDIYTAVRQNISRHTLDFGLKHLIYLLLNPQRTVIYDIINSIPKYTSFSNPVFNYFHSKKVTENLCNKKLIVYKDTSNFIRECLETARKIAVTFQGKGNNTPSIKQVLPYTSLEFRKIIAKFTTPINHISDSIKNQGQVLEAQVALATHMFNSCNTKQFIITFKDTATGVTISTAKELENYLYKYKETIEKNLLIKN